SNTAASVMLAALRTPAEIIVIFRPHEWSRFRSPFESTARWDAVTSPWSHGVIHADVARSPFLIHCFSDKIRDHQVDHGVPHSGGGDVVGNRGGEACPARLLGVDDENHFSLLLCLSLFFFARPRRARCFGFIAAPAAARRGRGRAGH